MARIPTAANVAQAPSVRDPGVRVPAIGQEVARGLMDVGRGLSALAEKQQMAEDRRFLADFDSAVRTRTAETVLQFEGQQESSDYSARVTEAVQGIGTSVLQEFEAQGYTPSQDARVRAETGFTGLLTNTRVSAITDQHNAKVAAALRGIQSNADVHLNTLMSNPSREALDATRDLLTETFDAAEGLANPDVLARLRDEYQGGAYKSYVSGLISKGQLGLARQELATDEANEALDPNDKARLQNELERESRAFVAQKASEVQQALKGIETVVGVAPPSTAMIDAAQAQIDSLPPSMRAPAQARLDALVTVGQQNELLYYMPPDAQASLQRQMDTALRQGATPEMIERKKVIDDIVESSQEQREQDATVLAVGSGNAIAPKEPMDLTNPDYQRQARDVSTATVSLYGLDVQPLPREAYDEVERSLTTGTNAEGVAAVEFLGNLGLAARSAVLGQLGAKVTPLVRTSIDVAGSRPDLAEDLIKANAKAAKGDFRGYSTAKIAEVQDQLDVGTAFEGFEGALTDTIRAAQTLVSMKNIAGTLSETDLVEATKLEAERILEGRVVNINSGQVFLPEHLRSTPSRPTAEIVVDRLSQMETLEDFSRVVEPITAEMVQPMPENATFEGLFYEGRGDEQVSLEDFADATLHTQIAPGVYVAHIDGPTGRGPVSARYTVQTPEGPKTADFRAAINLNKVVSLPVAAPSELPENIRLLREEVQSPPVGSEERFEAQRRLREAERAR